MRGRRQCVPAMTRAFHGCSNAVLESRQAFLTPVLDSPPLCLVPRIFVIGGPNGAGKTTIAGGLLPGVLDCDEYVNADAIAKALSPFESDRAAFKAGRVILEAIHDLAKRRKDFAFETTMASRSFVPFLSNCRDQGYEISLLWLRSVALAQRHVAKRVRGGATASRTRSSGVVTILESATSLNSTFL